jgi:hypothetical protein
VNRLLETKEFKEHIQTLLASLFFTRGNAFTHPTAQGADGPHHHTTTDAFDMARSNRLAKRRMIRFQNGPAHRALWVFWWWLWVWGAGVAFGVGGLGAVEAAASFSGASAIRRAIRAPFARIALVVAPRVPRTHSRPRGAALMFLLPWHSPLSDRHRALLEVVPLLAHACERLGPGRPAL